MCEANVSPAFSVGLYFFCPSRSSTSLSGRHIDSTCIILASFKLKKLPNLLKYGANSSRPGINTLGKQLELPLRWDFCSHSSPLGHSVGIIFVILLSQLCSFLSDACIWPLFRQFLSLCPLGSLFRLFKSSGGEGMQSSSPCCIFQSWMLCAKA